MQNTFTNFADLDAELRANDIFAQARQDEADDQRYSAAFIEPSDGVHAGPRRRSLPRGDWPSLLADARQQGVERDRGFGDRSA